MPIIVLLTALFLFLPAQVTALAPIGPQDSPSRSAKGTDANRLGADPEGQIAYSDIKKALSSPELKEVTLSQIGQAELLFRDSSQATSTFPPDQLSRLSDIPKKATVQIGTPSSSSDSLLGSFFSTGLPVIVIFILLGFFFYFINRKGNKKVASEKDVAPQSQNTFSDVAGYEEVIEEMREFVQFLRAPEKFHALGARIPSGAILFGPPGTGKTLMARALAGEAGVPFYYLAGSEAINKYVGVGASTIRSLFRKARKSEDGAVIFIDEIDAMGKARSGAAAGGGDREYDQTLNQLLVELDGFRPADKIVVFAATNRLDTLDPALLRPGRLTRHIPVLLPSEKAREAILRLHAKGKPLAADADLHILARITAGSSGATLAEIINEGAIVAAREGAQEITGKHLQDGHLRAIAGPEHKESQMSKEERHRVAVHEAGHVLAAELCSEHEKAQRVTIRSRGMAGGLALYGQEDRALHSPEYIHQQILCLLAGRAAERVLLGAVSSGAANDLQRATELARRSIEEWGLSPLTGQIVTRGHDAVSDATRSVVDQEVERSVAEAFSDAVGLLESNKHSLQDLADALVQQETLERVDIIATLGKISSDWSRSDEASGPTLQPALAARQASAPAHGQVRRVRAPRSKVLLMSWRNFLHRRRKAGAAS